MEFEESKEEALQLMLNAENEIRVLRERVRQLEVAADTQATYFLDGSRDKKIFELVTEFNELNEEKLDLETQFAAENTRFFQLIEKLSDKLRLIALTTIEMDGKIRILNVKVPELEQNCYKQDQVLDNVIFKFKNNGLNEMKELEENIRITEENIKRLENEIFAAKQKNREVTWEIDAIVKERLHLLDKYEIDKDHLKEAINKAETRNMDLELQIEKISRINKEACEKKINTLKNEIEILTTQIQKTKCEKLGIIDENDKLKATVKKLVLQKVFSEHKNS